MFIIIFFLLESAMLNIIFKFFIRNIDDHEIRKKVIQNIIIINRFLRFVYNFIKEIKRINVKI